MNESFYAGMIAYEQLCEEMLMRSILPDWYKRFIQIHILDKAQREFELMFRDDEEQQ